MTGFFAFAPGREGTIVSIARLFATEPLVRRADNGALTPRRVVRSSFMPGVFLLKKLAGGSASASFGVLADCGRRVMRQAKPSLTQVAS